MKEEKIHNTLAETKKIGDNGDEKSIALLKQTNKQKIYIRKMSYVELTSVG